MRRHIHYLQTEYFQVKKGVLGATKDGKDYRVTSEDGILTIPAGTRYVQRTYINTLQPVNDGELISCRHRFWAHESGSEDLVFHVWAEPQDLDDSFDVNFLRNFQGYLADCHKAGMEPSFLQIVLLLHGAATVLCPPFWVPIWILRTVSYVLARWVAAGLLGWVNLSFLLI